MGNMQGLMVCCNLTPYQYKEKKGYETSMGSPSGGFPRYLSLCIAASRTRMSFCFVIRRLFVGIPSIRNGFSIQVGYETIPDSPPQSKSTNIIFSGSLSGL